MNKEVGERIAIDKLSAYRGKIVCVQAPGRPMITCWVKAADADGVLFYAGVVGIHVLAFIEDGLLVDDQGREIEVYEYLGTP